MDYTIMLDVDTGAKSPGPAAYSIKQTIGKYATDPSIERHPAYTMLERRPIIVKSLGPGPAYDTTRLSHYGKDRAVGGLMRIRLHGLRKAITPGPTDYCIRSPNVVGGYWMRQDVGRKPGYKCWPSPNEYLLPSTNTRHSAKIGERLLPLLKCPTPGPADYVITPPRPVGRTMGKRLVALKKCITPGPADYDGLARADCCNRCSVKNQVCGTTFGIRMPRSVPPYVVKADNERDDDCRC